MDIENKTIGIIIYLIVTLSVGFGIYNHPKDAQSLAFIFGGLSVFVLIYYVCEAAWYEVAPAIIATSISLIINILFLIWMPSLSLWLSLCFALCASGAIIAYIQWLRNSAEQQRIEKANSAKQQRIEEAKHIIKESVWWDKMPRNGTVLLDTNIWMDDRLSNWFKYLPEILNRAGAQLLLPGFIIDEVQALLHSDNDSKKRAARLARDRMDTLLNHNCVITKNVSAFDKKTYGDPKIITFATQNSNATIYTNDKMLIVRLKAKCNEMNIRMPKVYTFDRDYPHFCIPEELAQAYSELSEYRY